MAFAEHEVLIQRDAMAVYLYLVDATNLPLWRDGVRSVKLLKGSAGTKGAVYRKMVAGRSGLSIPADLEITEARPGAEIQFRVTSGLGRRVGGYYLSSEPSGTRVRFALEVWPEGRLAFLHRLGFLSRMAQRNLSSEVAQLDRLEDVMELQPAI
jgi:uncharacterized membrane protein